MAAELSDEEMMRYNRQIVLRGLILMARKRSGASVLVVGHRRSELRRRGNTSPRGCGQDDAAGL